MIHHDVLKPSSDKKGFTIVELLIAIVIIGILAAIVIAYLNPAEISALARDSNRVTDTNNIKRAIDLFVIDKTDPTLLGVSQKVYISIPDTSATCANITSLPTLPSGWSYGCVTAANLRNANGTGWLPINFTTLATGSPMNSLPIDPQNNATSGKYYTYTVNNTNGLYEVSSLLESQKENSTAVNDGGSLPGVYQAGTSIGLTPPTRDKGLVGYWAFEGSGAIANGQTAGLVDSSGKGYNGTALNTNTTGMTFIAGKVGNAIQFDGVDDGITIPVIYTGNTDWTLSAWAKTTSSDFRSILSNASGGPVYNAMGVNGTKITYDHYNGLWKFENGNVTVNDNGWHLLLWVNNGTTRTIDLYVDGSKDLSAATSITDANAPVNKLGGAWGGSYSWNGAIDDIRFYNRTLSSSEVRAIYDATK